MPSLCAKGCGFFANATLGGMCSKCYREEQAAQDKAKAALAASVEPPATASPTPAPAVMPAAVMSTPSPAPAAATPVAGSSSSSGGGASAAASAEGSPATPADPEPGKPSNRCQQCRKKVGLAAGFKCRCGLLFCGQHRYAEAHNCTFDYKTAEREKLAANNPLVQASKVERI